MKKIIMMRENMPVAIKNTNDGCKSISYYANGMYGDNKVVFGYKNYFEYSKAFINGIDEYVYVSNGTKIVKVYNDLSIRKLRRYRDALAGFVTRNGDRVYILDTGVVVIDEYDNRMEYELKDIYGKEKDIIIHNTCKVLKIYERGEEKSFAFFVYNNHEFEVYDLFVCEETCKITKIDFNVNEYNWLKDNITDIQNIGYYVFYGGDAVNLFTNEFVTLSDEYEFYSVNNKDLCVIYKNSIQVIDMVEFSYDTDPSPYIGVEFDNTVEFDINAYKFMRNL